MSRAFAALPLVVVATLSDGGTAHAGGHNSHTGTSPPTGHVTLGRRPGARQWIKGLCTPSIGKPAKCMDIPTCIVDTVKAKATYSTLLSNRAISNSPESLTTFKLAGQLVVLVIPGL